MTRRRLSLSGELLGQTQEVFEALQSGYPRDEVERLVERQREAFSEFSRHCDTGQALDTATRNDIDQLLRLNEKIVASLGRDCNDLIERSRAIAGRRSQVQAFYSRGQEPPRFVTRHV